MVINGFLRLHLHPVLPSPTTAWAMGLQPPGQTAVPSSPTSYSAAEPQHSSTNTLQFTASQPVLSRTVTKMEMERKWNGEEKSIGLKGGLSNWLFICSDRSQLITFAVAVRFQKIGLLERSFCWFMLNGSASCVVLRSAINVEFKLLPCISTRLPCVSCSRALVLCGAGRGVSAQLQEALTQKCRQENEDLSYFYC